VLRDAELMPLSLVLWQANYSVYRSRKPWIPARRAGHGIGRDHLARLMRQLGIRGVKRTKKVNTARTGPAATRPGDLVALRVNVGFGLLVLGWWSCYQESSGLVVGGVGESVCGSSEGL